MVRLLNLSNIGGYRRGQCIACPLRGRMPPRNGQVINGAGTKPRESSESRVESNSRDFLAMLPLPAVNQQKQ